MDLCINCQDKAALHLSPADGGSGGLDLILGNYTQFAVEEAINAVTGH